MVEADIPAAAVIGVVAAEHLERRSDGDAVDIAGVVRPDFEAATVVTKTDHAAAAHRQLAAIGAGGAVHALVAKSDIDPTIDADLERVLAVVDPRIGDGAAEVTDQNLGLIGHAIVV